MSTNLNLRENGRLLWVLCFLPAGLIGCIVDEQCRENRDCPAEMLCNATSKECYYECETSADCGGDQFRCEHHKCYLSCEQTHIVCPEGMVSVCGAVCMDVYEASRPDATETHGGTDESMATSRAGVVPWYSGDLPAAQAAQACAAAGKRLCTGPEWEMACAGMNEYTYTYGNEYDPAVCNSRDTFCDPECGVFVDCYRECDYDHHILPTGSMQGCTNLFGIFDLSGNTWEAVESIDEKDHFRGGAYDCGDPGLAHKCTYDAVVAGAFPATRGFRCCADGDPM